MTHVDQIYESKLDDPELAPLWEENLRRARVHYETSSAMQRLGKFLRDCSQRGKKYYTGRNRLPNLKQVAKYCNQHESTINRIASGEQTSIKTEVLDVLFALACVTPPCSWDDFRQEQFHRLADADDCIAHGCKQATVVLDAVLVGVRKRAAAKYESLV